MLDENVIFEIRSLLEFVGKVLSVFQDLAIQLM